MTLYIPTVGNVRSLSRALDSLGARRGDAIVIDNSDHGLPELGVEVRRPSVPLSFVQTMNWMQELSWEQDHLFFMHDDAHFTDAEAFGEFAANLPGPDRDWGVAFTLYDSCCAMNMRVVKQVGSWDVGLSQYFADDDYYRRIRLAGYETFDDDRVRGRIVHDGSLSQLDPYYKMRTETMCDYAKHYYRRKWGGPPKQEVFRVPFDGELRRSWLASIRDTEAYRRLSGSFGGDEGNLLETTEEAIAVPQVEAMLGFLRMSRPIGRPIRVLETGTNKGMFGLLLSRLGGGELWTHDCDSRTKEVAETMKVVLPNIDLHYHHGNSEVGLGRLEDAGYFDMFWVDGGHDIEVCISDLEHAKRLRVPVVVIDDGNMESVDKAIGSVLGGSEYVEIRNELKDLDHRKMRGFRISGHT